MYLQHFVDVIAHKAPAIVCLSVDVHVLQYFLQGLAARAT